MLGKRIVGLAGMTIGDILIAFLVLVVACFLFAVIEEAIKEHKRNKKK